MLARPVAHYTVRRPEDISLSPDKVFPVFGSRTGITAARMTPAQVEGARRTIAWIQRLVQHPEVGALSVNTIWRSAQVARRNDSGLNSRHHAAVACDLNIFAPGSGRTLRSAEAAAIARKVPGFDRISVYTKKNHIHVDFPRDLSAAGAGALIGIANGEAYEISDPARFVSAFEHREAFDVDDTLEHDHPHDPDGSMLRALSVLEGEEKAALADLPRPAEGEFDIGDIRFGSELFDAAVRQFRSPDDPQLNQPTAVTQQNASSVGVVETLRTDMSPVLAENRFLPEVQIELTVNATYRDDVNRVLRPLFAMMRRAPFVPVRNADVARLMLGISAQYTVAQHVEQESPELYEILKAQDRLDEVYDLEAADLWVPCTFRSISAATQPGAKDLYQVTITLQYANVSAYAPQMLLWKRTEDALEWARYLSFRSDQGAVVTEAVEGLARVVTTAGKHVEVRAPDAVRSTGHQTASPHESYVFKKFYRGLLEEYQGNETFGTYRLHLDAGELDAIRPIGQGSGGVLQTTAAGQTEPGVFEGAGSTRPPGPVYEPAYPIGDPLRTMEVYEPGVTMGLGYITASTEGTRAGRKRRLEKAFEERLTEIGLMRRAAAAFGVRGGETKGLGDISPITLAFGKDLTLMMATMNYTVRQLNDVVSRAVAATSGANPGLQTRTYHFELDGRDVRVVPDNGSPLVIPAESVVSGIARDASFVASVVDFPVNDPTHPTLLSSFSHEARKVQAALLGRYVEALYAVEKRALAFPAYGNPGTGSGRQPDPAVVAFFGAVRDLTNALEAGDADGATAAARALGVAGPSPATTTGTQWLMSGTFLALLGEQPFVTADDKDRLRQIIDDAVGLNQAVYDQLQQDKEARADAYLDGGGRTEKGFLSFERSAIEGLRVSERNRFADRPWDSYAEPVTQHIGGSNTEVSLDIVTSDPVLLTQLSELKRSQTVLAEQRKKGDVTPPVVDVFGQGTLLRALGVRQLAYRAHTTFAVKDNPGYYRVRLDLIQDESTLVRTERFERVAGLAGATLFNTFEAAPLLTPVDDRPDESPAPLTVWELVRRVYSPDGVVQGTAPADYWHQPRVFSLDSYRDLPTNEALRQMTPTGVTVRYQPPREGRARALDVEVIHMGEGGIANYERPDLDAVFARLIDFLDYCHREYPATADDAKGPALERLSAGVEAVLGSTGRQSGWVAGLLQVATLLHSELEAGATTAVSGGTGGGGVLIPGATADTARDNLTLFVADLLAGEELPAVVSAASMGLRASADDLSRLVVTNDTFRALYLDWISVTPDPRGEPVAGATADSYPFNWAGLVPSGDGEDEKSGSIEALARVFAEMRSSMPTCYPDLLMPEVRDPETGANVLGYDFPFGPGADLIVEDTALADYRYAEELRLINAVQIASVGVDVIERHLRDDGELGGARTGAPGSTTESQRLTELLQQIRQNQLRGLTEEADELEAEFVAGLEATPLAAAYGQAVRTVSGQGTTLAADLGALRELGIFSGRPAAGKRQMTAQDWANTLRTAQTLQYTALVMDLAQMSGKPFSEALAAVDADGAALAVGPRAVGASGSRVNGPAASAPATPASGPAGPLSPNARRAYEYLVGNGWTSVQAAGLVGNLMAESTVNLNPASQNSIGAIGIAQWLDRAPALRAFARRRGKEWSDFETQLAFIQHELNGPEAAAARRLRAATTLRDSTFAGVSYERPEGWGPNARPEDIDDWSRRFANAQSVRVGGGGLSKGTDTGVPKDSTTTPAAAPAAGPPATAAYNVLGRDPQRAPRTGATQLEISGVSRAVQTDPNLARLRNDLVRLYQSDPEVIAERVGFTDLSSEPYRKDLMDKLRAQWTQWLGLRRAFPSYALLVVGPVGSPHVRMLSDAYAWTAVNRIEVRRQASSAGGYCDLELSNLRNRLSNPLDRRNISVMGDPWDNHTGIEVTHGTHMNVFVGYGPDVAHLYPFAGRVTDVLPGPVTTVRLASYGATMNNAPNQGQGFYTSGAHAQRSLADVVMFTIAQTDGLEGLGRGALMNLQDVLARGPRGNEVDDYKAGLFLSLYKSAGMPGLDGQTEQDAAEVLGTINRMGLSSFKDLVYGSPRLFENIWLAASPTRKAGITDLAFGTLVERFTNGEGWGWAGMPGETCWAILQDLALLYPDYVVTTRPYNVGTTLDKLARHPVRETLYFGPRHGSYISTSDPKRVHSSASDFVLGHIDSFLAEYGAQDGASGDGTASSGAALTLRLYNDLFLTNMVTETVLESIEERPGGVQATVEETVIGFFSGLGAWFRGLLGGEEAPGDAASAYDLDGVVFTDAAIEALYREIGAAFPRTVAAAPRREGYFVGNWMTTSRFLAQFMVAPELLDGQRLGPAAEQVASRYGFEIRTPEAALSVLEAFKADLADLATSAEVARNLGLGMGSSHRDHPLIAFLEQKAAEKGYVKATEWSTLSRHHFLSGYTNIIENRVQSSDSDPDFANQVTLSFPQKADERLEAGFSSDPGARWEYTIQAAPTIHPDFIVNDSVYFANLRRTDQDVITLAGAQQTTAAGELGPIELLRKYNELSEKLAAVYSDAERGAVAVRSGTADAETFKHIDEEALEIEREMHDVQTMLERTPYVKPKYQTVATNILQSRIRRMYQGEVILHGDPRIQPYDVVHIWDDAKMMHGPAEVDSVLHYFGAEGFYTAVTPKLATFHRAVDQTADVQYLDQAAGFYHKVALWTRYGGGGVAVLSGTAMASGLLQAGAAGTGAVSGALGSLGALFGGAAALGAGLVTGVVAAVAAAWWMASTGEDMAKQYAGYVGDITTTNPIVFVPLTQRLKPLVAGLTGATGPATIRTAIADAVDLARRDGRVPALQEWYGRYFEPRSL